MITVTLSLNELIILAVGLVILVCVSFIAARYSTHALIETILLEIDRHRPKETPP